MKQIKSMIATLFTCTKIRIIIYTPAVGITSVIVALEA